MTTELLKTACTQEAIAWHLNANAFGLSDKAFNSILQTVEDFNNHKISLTDTITPDVDITVGEMFEDMGIEVVSEFEIYFPQLN